MYGGLAARFDGSASYKYMPSEKLMVNISRMNFKHQKLHKRVPFGEVKILMVRIFQTLGHH